MTGSTGFEPTRALAVVMGTSRWEAGAYEDNAACRNSAEAFHAYLVDPQGLGLADEDVLAVIDDESPYPGQILERIHEFIAGRKKALQDEQRSARDLLRISVKWNTHSGDVEHGFRRSGTLVGA